MVPRRSSGGQLECSHRSRYRARSRAPGTAETGFSRPRDQREVRRIPPRFQREVSAAGQVGTADWYGSQRGPGAPHCRGDGWSGIPVSHLPTERRSGLVRAISPDTFGHCAVQRAAPLPSPNHVLKIKMKARFRRPPRILEERPGIRFRPEARDVGPRDFVDFRVRSANHDPGRRDRDKATTPRSRVSWDHDGDGEHGRGYKTRYEARRSSFARENYQQHQHAEAEPTKSFA